ncbi:MAG: hypothetical protein DRQ35_07415, partial [Gammaproteobacteria bacterium]
HEGYRNNRKVFEDNTGITARNAEKALRQSQQHDRDLKHITANARIKVAEMRANSFDTAAKAAAEKNKGNKFLGNSPHFFKAGDFGAIGSDDWNIIPGSDTKETDQNEAAQHANQWSIQGLDKSIIQQVIEANRYNETEVDYDNFHKQMQIIYKGAVAGVNPATTMGELNFKGRSADNSDGPFGDLSKGNSNSNNSNSENTRSQLSNSLAELIVKTENNQGNKSSLEEVSPWVEKYIQARIDAGTIEDSPASIEAFLKQRIEKYNKHYNQ